MTSRVLKNEAEENRGENARMLSFIGATAVGDLVKTTLGPKGMDKILQSVGRSSDIQVTNDGATILRAIHIDNAAAKILVDISRVQDEEVGDGTTSVCVLASELLKEGEKLLEKQLHPQTIIAGWRAAARVASEALQKIAVSNKDDVAQLRADLLNIARTTLSSKILMQHRDFFSEMAVDAVLKLGGSTNLDSIQIIKKTGGSLADSFLDRDGFILAKKIGVGQPKRMENCKILLANTAMDNDKIKVFGAGVRVESTAKVAEIEEAEREKMTAKVTRILEHKCNVFVNRQLIYNYPEQMFAEHGVMAIEHADFDGIERLALVTGGEIVSTFDHPELVRLGECALIEEIMIGEDRMIRFGGCPNAHACTVVLRGPGKQVLDEAERSLHDALCVLSQTVASDTRVVLGGGNAEVTMAAAVDDLARNTMGKQALAIEAFARALRQLPTIMADNAGFDSSELVTRLRAAIVGGASTSGLDMQRGEVGDMAALGIKESFKVKHQVLISAAEAAEMIMRVDDVIKCAPRRREEDPHMH